MPWWRRNSLCEMLCVHNIMWLRYEHWHEWLAVEALEEFNQARKNIMTLNAKSLDPIWSHFYNSCHKPVATVCYLDSATGTAIGMSICSPRDVPCKSKGRRISYQRACFALENHLYWGALHLSGGYPKSEVIREEPISVLWDSDIAMMAYQTLSKEDRIYKISYIDKSGFRFERVSWERP